MASIKSNNKLDEKHENGIYVNSFSTSENINVEVSSRNVVCDEQMKIGEKTFEKPKSYGLCMKMCVRYFFFISLVFFSFANIGFRSCQLKSTLFFLSRINAVVVRLCCIPISDSMEFIFPSNI